MGAAEPARPERVEPHPSERDFPNADTSPKAARAWIGDLLDGQVDGDTLYYIKLMLSELVANSHLYTKTKLIHVDVLSLPGLVRVEVSDNKSGEALPRIGNDRDDGGRGLGLVVDPLADDWGIIVQAHRVTVWFEIKTG